MISVDDQAHRGLPKGTLTHAHKIHSKKPLASLIACLVLSGVTGAAVHAQELQTPSNDVSEDKFQNTNQGQIAKTKEKIEEQDIEDASSTMEEVYVTGIRASQRGAIELKRNAGTMSDSIIAEDVSKFPDKNVAEALQRITGVQMTRDFGEGAGINIRGMESALTKAEIDGVTALGNGGSRSVDFNNMAAELVKVLTVVKGSEARITEGGVGGTVMLEMRKPNEFDENFFSGSFEQQYNDLSKDFSPRANVTGVFKITDDLGVMMNVNASDVLTMIHALRNTEWKREADYDNSPERSVNLPQYADAATQDDCITLYGNGSTVLTDEATECIEQWMDFSPADLRYGNWSRQEKRISSNFAIGWDVNESLSTFADITFNQRDKQARDLNLNIGTGSAEAINPDSVFVDAAHNVRAFETRNASIFNRTLDFAWLQRTVQTKAGFDFSSGAWDIRGVFANSRSKQDIDSRDAHISQTGVAGVKVVLDEKGAPEFDLTSGYRFADPDSPAPYEFEVVDINDPTAYNSRARFKYSPVVQHQGEDSAKLDIDFNLDSGFISKLRTGVRYALQDMTETNYETNIIRDVGTEYAVTDSNGEPVLDENGEAVLREWTREDMATLVSGTTRETDRFFPNYDLGVGTIGSYQAVDTDVLLGRLIDVSNTSVDRNQLPPRPGAYFIESEVISGYVQADFDMDIGSMRFWGNVGLRYVHTETQAHGDVTITTYYDQYVENDNGDMVVATVDGTPVEQGGEPLTSIGIPTFDGRDSSIGRYDDVLPSVNLNLSLIPDVLNFYFGAAKVMAHPKIEELNIEASCKRYETYRSQSPQWDIRNECEAGNPNLDPYRADQYDLAVMWYPNEDTLVSTAIFSKRLTSYLGPVETSLDVDFFAGGQNAGTLYDVEQVSNIYGVTTQGIELQARTVFSYLPSLLSHLGGEFNYTYMTAKDIPYVSQLDGSTLPLLGQSKNSYNVSVFYEDDHWSARLAYNFRSEYLKSTADRSGAPVFVDEAGHLDGKVSYEFGDSGLQIYADARNILGEVKLESSGQGRLADLQWAGRTYSLGIAFKH